MASAETRRARYQHIGGKVARRGCVMPSWASGTHKPAPSCSHRLWNIDVGDRVPDRKLTGQSDDTHSQTPIYIQKRSCKPLWAGIDNLPDELLTSVFKAAQPDYCANSRSAPRGYDVNLTVCAVSRRWRYLATSNASLWTTICASPRMQHCARLYLDRSKPRAIEVHLDFYTSLYAERLSDDSYSLLSLAIMHASRWRRLHVQVCDRRQHEAVMSALESAQTPILEELSFRITVGSSAVAARELLRGDATAQKFSALRLSGGGALTGTPSLARVNWFHAERFDLAEDWRILRQKLVHARSLVRLHFHAEPDGGLTPTATHLAQSAVTLPRLRVLAVNEGSAGLCALLELPSLDTVEVLLRSLPESVVSSFNAPRSSCDRVRTLRVLCEGGGYAPPPEPLAWETFAACFPSVTCVQIESGSKTWGSAFLQASAGFWPAVERIQIPCLDRPALRALAGTRLPEYPRLEMMVHAAFLKALTRLCPDELARCSYQRVDVLSVGDTIRTDEFEGCEMWMKVNGYGQHCGDPTVRIRRKRH